MNKKSGFLALALSAAVMLTTKTGFSVSSSSGTLFCSFADSSKKIPGGGIYTISAYVSGKYLTAGNDDNVSQYSDSGGSNQKWKIVSVGNGACAVFSLYDESKALTVEGGSNDNGSNICISEYKNLSSQHFILHRAGACYYITAECSGNAALDVYDQSTENGANIDQWDYWGGDNQKFYIDSANNGNDLMCCDFNGDGNVNICDRILMQYGIANDFDSYLKYSADLNKDKTVNYNDLILFNDYFFGSSSTDAGKYISLPESEGNDTCYLFAYFNGNAPEEERLSYAVSLDGYNFTALNNKKPVWQSNLGTGCIRDPFIFKGQDDYYYMLATDMKSSLGWSSNKNLIRAKSKDLINWTDTAIIEIAGKYSSTAGCDRAWAPQAIWDESRNSYMIYWANHSNETGSRTIMYYAYSKDLKNLDTAPSLLFAPANGDSAIDSDIIFQNGTYYMYYKNETNKRIYLAKASNASGPYKEIKQISEGSLGVEGPNIYNLAGTNQWLLMSDAYGDGYYVMQETSDLENFTTLNRNDYSFDFTPRHGYVIPISGTQYDDLLSAFPSNSVPKRNTNTSRSDSSYPDPFITERADPYIVDGENGYYYFTASYPAYGSVDKGYDRIILRRSNTVSGLARAEEKTIWKAHSSGIMAKHIWAPEMHKINNTWYIFFAAGSDSNIWAIKPYVLKCSGDPYTGQWTECGQMQPSYGDTSSFSNFSLDMTYFENNGKHYVIWAEIKGDSSLFMAQIDPNEPYKLINKPIMLTKPEYDWEMVNNRVNEGASVLKTDNKIYVYFSASGTGSEYCVGRLEADINSDLMNLSNWKKLSYPVLSTADLTNAAGPGHNCFVTDENGDLLFVYHARPASHSSKSCGTYNADPLYDPCRHTRIKKVEFDAFGTPVIR